MISLTPGSVVVGMHVHTDASTANINSAIQMAVDDGSLSALGVDPQSAVEVKYFQCKGDEFLYAGQCKKIEGEISIFLSYISFGYFDAHKCFFTKDKELLTA